MKKTLIVVAGKSVYVSVTGKVRIGAKGAAAEAGEVFATLGRGEARRVRKGLRAEGFIHAASARRVA